MRILLVRHGQTPYNLDGTIDTTVPGAPLTELGVRQAEAIPDAIASHPLDGIFVSTLHRTALTAAPLAARRQLEPSALDGLREIRGGDYELHSAASSQNAYLDIVFGWARGETHRRIPGAESGDEFFVRYDGAMAAVLASGFENVLVVSHGSAIRTWVGGRCIDVEPDFAGHHQLDNTGMAVLDGDSLDSLKLIEWRAQPAGGALLADAAATDPIGKDLD